MGIEPGVASGYRVEPAATIGGVPTRPRKRTNHMWPGPDYSIVHPGIFPHNPAAKELASTSEWTSFDWQAGWGTQAFEAAAALDTEFPERWSSVDDRMEAREILDEQLALLDEVFASGTQLLARGYQLGEVEVERAVLGTRPSSGGLAFEIEVRNGTDGHNVPTGFIAERLVFLQVTVKDPKGAVIFRSGDLDPNGDVRNIHSVYVHGGALPLDEYLFNLQSKFITQNVASGEREQVLAVNFSLDPLPYVRPDPNPSILLGRPVTARIHRFGIEPDGRRSASYQVSGDALTDPGSYTINVKLIAGMVPSNLIHEIQSVGFDYGMSPREIADAVLAGHRVLAERELVVEVE